MTVGHPAQQGQVQVQHAGHCPVIQRQFAGGQEHQCHQVDRVDGRGFVQVPGDFLSQAISGRVQPLRPVQRGKFLLTPTRLLTVQKLGKFDRFAEVDRHLAEFLFLEGADHFEYVEN